MFKPSVILGMVALVVTCIAGEVVSRVMTSSSSKAELLPAAVQCLEELPKEIGSWKMVKEEELPDDLLERMQPAGYKHRMYRDSKTGQFVDLTLLTGSAIALLSSTPDLYYPDYGLRDGDPPQQVGVRGSGRDRDEFDRTVYPSDKLASRKLRVMYGWRRAQGHWEAPVNARMRLGMESFLFKVQLASANEVDTSKEGKDRDPLRRFLDQLLPVLDTILVVQ
ncbi:MAG: hypothetical protein ACKV0T_18085 [Planctomycetales bacterium]